MTKRSLAGRTPKGRSFCYKMPRSPSSPPPPASTRASYVPPPILLHLSSASCHFPFRVGTPAISSLAYCTPNAAGPAPTPVARASGCPEPARSARKVGVVSRVRLGRPRSRAGGTTGWAEAAAILRKRSTARRDGPLGLGLHRLCLRRGQDVWVTVVLRWGSPRLLDRGL